jgi:hypothetical protein
MEMLQEILGFLEEMRKRAKVGVRYFQSLMMDAPPVALRVRLG